MSDAGPERLVFVGGAPRSGTTVLHALICSAGGVSDYHPEISFFRGFAGAYRNGMLAWSEHTSAFFADREAFRRHMRAHADMALRAVWESTGRAPVLACKDPLLTPWFPDLRELYADNASFVVAVRDPAQVIRSRQEVHERSGSQGPFTAAHVERLAGEYLAGYHAVLSADFGERLLVVRYEDLNSDDVRRGLRSFLGVAAFDPARMWGRSAGSSDEGAWGSPKYCGPIDLDQRLPPLAPEHEAIVRRVCAPVMKRFGYG